MSSWGVPHGFYYFVFLAILSTLLGRFVFPYNGNWRVVATPHYLDLILTPDTTIRKHIKKARGSIDTQFKRKPNQSTEIRLPAGFGKSNDRVRAQEGLCPLAILMAASLRWIYVGLKMCKTWRRGLQKCAPHRSICCSSGSPLCLLLGPVALQNTRDHIGNQKAYRIFVGLFLIYVWWCCYQKQI